MDRRHFIKLSATAAAAILSGVSNPALAEKVLPKTSAIDLEIDSYTVLFRGCYIPDPKDFRVGDIYSVASMKIHRELGITQKAAWHLAHRVRKGWGGESQAEFEGPVEADESYFGGKRKNMSKARRAVLDGRGVVGKTAVVAVKDRPSKKVRAQVVERTDAETLQGFVLDSVAPGARVFTDEARAYEALPNREAVAHSLLEYVRGQVHTNGVESFWSMLKRAHMGTFHHLSPHHLHRYVTEFSGRHNMRGLDTLAQMSALVRLMDGQRLRYKDLVA